MTSEQQDYLAYMLRLWQVNDGERPTWRASLESPHTGERQGFADLGRLFQFLQDKTDDLSRYQALLGRSVATIAGGYDHVDNNDSGFPSLR